MPTDARPQFKRIDGGFEYFDPFKCIHEVVKRFQGTCRDGEVELARLKLPDGSDRIVEQRCSLYLGYDGQWYGWQIRTEYHQIKTQEEPVNSEAIAKTANNGENGAQSSEIRLTPAFRNILQTLLETRGRLTREQLLEAMERA